MAGDGKTLEDWIGHPITDVKPKDVFDFSAYADVTLEKLGVFSSAGSIKAGVSLTAHQEISLIYGTTTKTVLGGVSLQGLKLGGVASYDIDQKAVSIGVTAPFYGQTLSPQVDTGGNFTLTTSKELGPGATGGFIVKFGIFSAYEKLFDLMMSGAEGAMAVSIDHAYGSLYQQIGITTRCFPTHTRIQTSRTTSTAISALRVGDVVLAFDARADKGRGALVPRRVTRLYRNTTTDWLRLRWHDGAREMITTPGHPFLDAFGGFPTIEEMVKEGGARVGLASGALTQITGGRMAFGKVMRPYKRTSTIRTTHNKRAKYRKNYAGGFQCMSN